MTVSEQPDPYRTEGRSRRWSITRVIARGVGTLVGLGLGFFGTALYMLRCFSTCPSDPAENTISQILTLSLVVFGLVLVVAASSLGTRWAAAGALVITVLGGLMATGGIGTVGLAPSLQVPAGPSTTIILGIINLAAGVGLMLFGRRVGRSAVQGSSGHQRGRMQQ